jgi:DNA-binding CsgD family transcriptional regulator
MLSSIPIEAFENADDAVLLADDRGSVRMINRPAELLLGCAGGEALGRPCWEVARLHYRNGVPFCGPSCPVRRQARDNGGRIEKKLLARRRPRGRSLELELFTLVVATGKVGRCVVLHLLSPSPVPPRARTGALLTSGPEQPDRRRRRAKEVPALSRAADRLSPQISAGRRRLHLLSTREREILAALGRGDSTRRIAEELSISPNTVRNHIRSILEKLGVHRRLEAALLWLDRSV